MSQALSVPNASPFLPVQTVNLSVTDASARVAFGAFLYTSPRSVRILCLGSEQIVYIKFGDATVTAATTATMRMLTGSVEIFLVDPAWTHVAALCPTGETATLDVTSGHGQ